MKTFAAAIAAVLLASAAAVAQRIEVTLPSPSMHGHLILVFAKDTKSEPRMQVQEQYTSAQAFGVDTGLDGAPSLSTLTIDVSTLGYPLPTLAYVPAGDYTVQAVFNVYEQFHLATGQTVWLPPDRGEGQKWNRKPGNLLFQAAEDPLRPRSTPREIKHTYQTHARRHHPRYQRHAAGPGSHCAKPSHRKVAQICPFQERQAH